MSRAVKQEERPQAFVDERGGLVHDPELAGQYRAKTVDAQRRQQSGMAPEGAAQVAQPQPGGSGTVDVTLANQVKAKALRQLGADLARYERESQRFPAAMSGVVDPYQADRQRALQGAAEGVRVTMRELGDLEGEQLVQWAEESGRIRFDQRGNALI